MISTKRVLLLFNNFNCSKRLLCSTNIPSRQLVIDQLKIKHINNNIPSNIIEKIDRQLHLHVNHPLCIIKTMYSNIIIIIIIIIIINLYFIFY